jgi:glutathione S-transferase
VTPVPEAKPVEGDVIGPHVEIGQVEQAQLNDHQRAGSVPELGNHDADAQRHLCPAGDVHPELGPAQIVWNDGDKGLRSNKVLHPHPNERQSVQDGEDGLCACWIGHGDQSLSGHRLFSSWIGQNWIPGAVGGLMDIVLVYPKFPFWRAEVSRLALYLGDVEFENRHPSREEFRAAKTDGSLPFGQMPIMIVDGETIAQTGAIARFCGKLSGLYPTDSLAAAKVDQLIDAATDITTQVSPTMRMEDESAKMAARSVLAEDTLPKWFGYLEALLPEGEDAFFVGESMTIADLAIWRLMGWFSGGFLDGIPATVVDGSPRLKAHSERIGMHPKVTKWMRESYG